VSTPEEDKAEVLAQAAIMAARGPLGDGAPVLAYFRHVAPEHVLAHSPADLVEAVTSHRDLAVDRPPGRADVRLREAGGRTVVEVVTDDMPFLVDSVTMELARQGRDAQAAAILTDLARRQNRPELVRQWSRELGIEMTPAAVTGTAGL